MMTKLKKVIELTVDLHMAAERYCLIGTGSHEYRRSHFNSLSDAQKIDVIKAMDSYTPFSQYPLIHEK